MFIQQQQLTPQKHKEELEWLASILPLPYPDLRTAIVHRMAALHADSEPKLENLQ